MSAQSQDIIEVLFPVEFIKELGIKKISQKNWFYVYNSTWNRVDSAFTSQTVTYYDKAGNIQIALVNDRGGNGNQQKFNNIYDKSGMLLYSIRSFGSKDTTLLDTAYYYHDSLGRVNKILHRAGKGVWVRERNYENNFNLKEKFAYFLTSSGVIDSNSMIRRQYSYGKNGHLISIENYANNRLTDKKNFFRDLDNKIVVIFDEMYFISNNRPYVSHKYAYIQYDKRGLPQKYHEYLNFSEGYPIRSSDFEIRTKSQITRCPKSVRTNKKR